MKHLKSFNESIDSDKFHNLTKYEVREILDIFTDLFDEMQSPINREEMDNAFYSPSNGEIVYFRSTEYLDNNGDSEYQSVYLKNKSKSLSFTDREKALILKEHFNYYQQIIFNINYKSESSEVGYKKRVLEICSSIYDRLVSCGYRCSLWSPGYEQIRFHISSEHSNPFIKNSNNIANLIN